MTNINLFVLARLSDPLTSTLSETCIQIYTKTHTHTNTYHYKGFALS